MVNDTVKYDVILADPPWNYQNAGCRGAAEDQYPTMSIDEICTLPIQDIASKDSVLILWCTWPQLEDGLKVLKSWGFQYITGFPWIKIREVAKNLWDEIEIKVPYGVGFWARGCSEYVLIGKRGNISPPPNSFIGLLSPNLYHSRKPDDIYEYADSLPGRKIELFARRKRAGWDAWGNEVESSIILEPKDA